MMGIEHMARLATKDTPRLMRFEIANIIRTVVRNNKALSRRGISQTEENELVDLTYEWESAEWQLNYLTGKLNFLAEREFAGLDG